MIWASHMLKASICEAIPGGCDAADRVPSIRPSACARGGRSRLAGAAALWSAAGAAAAVDARGRARDRPPLRARQGGDPAGRVAVLRADRSGHQRAQEGAQRRHPGAQLPDAGNLQLRRGLCGRLAPARARGDEGRRRHHRAVRRALHGRDREDPQSRQDRADPRQQGRLLARGLDHRRRRAPAAREISGRAGGRLCQHLGRGEGRGRHLLHVVERRAGGREPAAPTR